MTAYRYYRFLATDVSWYSGNGGYYQVAFEAELYGSTDLSGTKISISGTDEDCHLSSYTAAYLIDGITTNTNQTYRSCTASEPHWFELDCGSDVEVASARVRYSAVSTGATCPKSIKIQGKVDGGSSYSDLAEYDIANFTSPKWVDFEDLQAGGSSLGLGPGGGVMMGGVGL